MAENTPTKRHLCLRNDSDEHRVVCLFAKLKSPTTQHTKGEQQLKRLVPTAWSVHRMQPKTTLQLRWNDEFSVHFEEKDSHKVHSSNVFSKVCGKHIVDTGKPIQPIHVVNEEHWGLRFIEHSDTPAGHVLDKDTVDGEMKVTSVGFQDAANARNLVDEVTIEMKLAGKCFSGPFKLNAKRQTHQFPVNYDNFFIAIGSHWDDFMEGQSISKALHPHTIGDDVFAHVGADHLVEFPLKKWFEGPHTELHLVLHKDKLQEGNKEKTNEWKYY